MSLRDVQRIVFNLLLGPLIGGILFFAAAALYEASIAGAEGGALLANFDPWRVGPPLLAFTYFVGLIPALLNGIVTSVVVHRTGSRGWRMLAALVSGAVWSGLIIGWVVATGDTAIAPPPVFITMVAVLGALTSLIVYLLFEWFAHRHRRHLPVGRHD